MSFRNLRPAAPAVVLAAGCLALACGHKQPPQPPPQIIPARTLDLRVQQRGGELLLSFTYPTTTLGGQPLGDLLGVEFWELVREVPLYPAAPEVPPPPAAEEGVEDPGDEPAASPATEADPAASDTGGPPAGWEPPERLEDLVTVDPLEFEAAAAIRLTLTGPELESAVLGEKITARFPLGDAPAGDDLQAHFFAVKTLSSTGLGSPFSNIARLVRREPPEAPTAFEVAPGSGGVELRWWFAGVGPDEGDEEADDAEPAGEAADEAAEPAEEVTASGETAVETLEVEGFNLYRRDARERSYGVPLRRVDREARTYVDRTARFGEAYIYAVAAVVEDTPLVESSLSAEREVDYTDRFAPPPPRNLVILAEEGSVRLLWDASTADDVEGYFVSRRSGSGEWVVLNAEPIRELEYTDREVVSGATYSYRVAAIDQVGNRSTESGAVEARVP